MDENEVKLGARLGSMVLDHIFMTTFAFVIGVPIILYNFIDGWMATEAPHDLIPTGSNDPSDFIGGSVYIGIIGFVLYFCKDCINGRSIAKRILSLQVVEYSSGQIASPLRTLARNFFIILWPIELIQTIANPSRRIGDIVAGTEVVKFDPEREQPAVNYRQVGVAFGVAYAALALTTWAFIVPSDDLDFDLDNIPPARLATPATIVDSSFNERLSIEMTQLFTDSLGALSTSNVSVYDHIEEDEELKFVVVFFEVHDGKFDDVIELNRLLISVYTLLSSRFDDATYVGKIELSVPTANGQRDFTSYLDWRDKTSESLP